MNSCNGGVDGQKHMKSYLSCIKSTVLALSLVVSLNFTSILGTKNQRKDSLLK